MVGHYQNRWTGTYVAAFRFGKEHFPDWFKSAKSKGLVEVKPTVDTIFNHSNYVDIYYCTLKVATANKGDYIFIDEIGRISSLPAIVFRLLYKYKPFL